jgi:hypothetical protein
MPCAWCPGCCAAVDLGAAANAQGFTVTDDAGRGAPTSGSQTQGAAITGAGEQSISINPALDLILGTGTGLRDGAAGLGRMRTAGIGEWLMAMVGGRRGVLQGPGQRLEAQIDSLHASQPDTPRAKRWFILHCLAIAVCSCHP